MPYKVRRYINISMGVSEMGPHLEAVLTGDSDGGFSRRAAHSLGELLQGQSQLCGISWNIHGIVMEY